MARPDHFGDCAATWNRINRELWAELGMKVPYAALAEIRRIRSTRGGRQGNTEAKDETKILLAIKQGLEWQHAYGRSIEHIKPRAQGGLDVLANIRLSEDLR